MESIMDLPNNTPKVAIQWIGRLQKENEKLKEDELTEESAIEYVYNHTDQYEDWIEGSTIYEELKEENKKLKAENKKLNERLMTPKEMSDKIDAVLS